MHISQSATVQLEKVVGYFQHKMASFLGPAGSIRNKVIAGGIWVYVFTLSQKGLYVLQTIILARLLTPEHFGVVGIATITIATLELFSNTGFKKALIQKRETDEDHLNVTWTVAVIRGLVLFVVLLLFAPSIARFFNTVKAISVIRVLAFSFLINGFSNVGTVYFLKKLEFYKLFLFRSCGILASLIVSVSLVFLLRNEWAIVWGILASHVALTVASYLFHSYRPRLLLNLAVFRELFKYSKWVVLSTLFVYIPLEGTKIVVIKLVGPASLGAYIIAIRFAALPQTMFNNMMQTVLFPTYAKFQDRPEQLKRVYFKALEFIMFACIPVSGALIVFAGPMVNIFLGDKWFSAIMVMRVLALAFLLDVTTNSGMHLFNACGRPDSSYRVTLFKLLILAVAIFPLTTQYGILGTGFAYLISSIIGFASWLWELGRNLQLHGRDFKFAIFPLCSTIVLMSFIYCLSFFVSLNQIQVFSSVLLLSVVSYLGLALLIHKFTRYEILKLSTSCAQNGY